MLPRHLGELVVDVEDGAARVAEDGVGAFFEQALEKNARPAHRLGEAGGQRAPQVGSALRLVY